MNHNRSNLSLRETAWGTGAKSRLIAGFSATAVGPLITAFVQLVSIPVFLRVWGPHLYGVWLILSAIPVYLSMTDIGFGSVAGNDMTMRVARSDFKGAQETLQSTWLLVLATSLCAAIVAGCLILFGPVTKWLRITDLSSSQCRVVLACLCLYSLGTLQASILISAYRSAGAYSTGTMSLNVVRFAENAVQIAFVWLGAGMVSAAIVVAAVRIAGTLVVYGVLVRRLPWLRFGYALASWPRIRELSRPALAFMAFPAGNAISIQGTTILIGFLLNPVAVATFNPMRTLSRFAFQIIDSIKNAAWPELSAAFGARNWELARKLHRLCCQTAFWLAIFAALGLAVTGPAVFRAWTHGRVTMDLTCFRLLLVIVVASSLWNASSAVSVAANIHTRLAGRYLTGTVGALAVGYLLIPQFGLSGAALSLLGCEIWMGCFVLKDSNRVLDDDTGDFLRSMFSLVRFRLLIGRELETVTQK